MSVKFLILFSLLAWLNIAHAQPCEFKRTDSLNESLDGIVLIQINALAGELEIVSDDRRALVVESQACADTLQHLADIRLDVKRADDTLTLTVVMDLEDALWDAEYAYADLVVKLPSTNPVAIRDSSGDITLRGISVTSIDDSSGKISGRDLTGDMIVQDSSGDIRLDRVKGSITLTDSSGDIELRDINGGVTVRSDGSGHIDIARATGTVEIGHDGSGDIDIDTSGPVSIRGDGSGEIVIRNVNGAVYIGTDGAGSVDIADVSGDFTLDAKGSGHIRTRRIGGAISIPREHEED